MPAPEILWLVDLPASETLPWTPQLLGMGLRVIPAINRWCTSPAALPCETLVADLVRFAPRDSSRAGHGVVILLDGERAGDPEAAADAAVFDNRHSQNTDMLPSTDFLLSEGVGRAVLVTPAIAKDLGSYLDRLTQGGVQVEVREHAHTIR